MPFLIDKVNLSEIGRNIKLHKLKVIIGMQIKINEYLNNLFLMTEAVSIKIDKTGIEASNNSSHKNKIIDISMIGIIAKELCAYLGIINDINPSTSIFVLLSILSNATYIR